MAVYRPLFVTQKDGSYHQWENCTMASAAMAIDRHTLGKIRTSGARMRQCQDDNVGGTDLIDAQTAWRRCWNKYLEVHLKMPWNTLTYELKNGHGAIVLGWYGYIPLKYRSQDHAAFGHAMYVNEIRASDGAMLVGDPLNNQMIWIPQYYIKQFAGHFSTTAGLLGVGYAQIGLTQKTADLGASAPITVTLRFGGVKIVPNLFEAKVTAKKRRSPYIRQDNVLIVVPQGTDFKAYQKTTAGTNVGGSSLWYGNATGTVWMHSSVLKDI